MDSNRKKIHLCTYDHCSAAFTKPSKLVYHIRRHTGERPFACDEPNCDKSYLFSFHLRRHKESHKQKKPPPERIKCTAAGCFLELANQYSLKKHIKRMHNPERYYAFTCDVCKQGFHRKKHLLHHTFVHTGVPTFQCIMCDARFVTKRDLNRHEHSHKFYPCKCGKVFERWTILLKHRKTCESIPLTCNICNITFTKKDYLRAHIRSHLTNQKFICGYENCERTYLYKKNLIFHIRRYHQKIIKTIECTVPGCKRTFSGNQNLQNHIKLIHSGKKQKKTARCPRKDKGKSKKCMAAVLAGLDMPLALHMAVIKGERIKLPIEKEVPNMNPIVVIKLSDQINSELRSRRNELRSCGSESDKCEKEPENNYVNIVC